MQLQRIASFEVDHNTLKRGIYTSRIDGDVTTYDIRMKLPNGGSYLETKAMHTTEHIVATFVRNSEFKDRIIYFGPMGCRTGFYLLVRGMEPMDVIALVQQAFKFLADFEGEVPGVSAAECGNYLEHDLEGAKAEAKEYLKVLDGYNAKMLEY